MKPTLIALLMAAATSAHAFSYGTVEKVREVRRDDGFLAMPAHAVRPQTGEELVVRLDDGSEVRVMEGEMQQLEPGTRVLVLGGTAVRVSSP